MSFIVNNGPWLGCLMFELGALTDCLVSFTGSNSFIISGATKSLSLARVIRKYDLLRKSTLKKRIAKIK